MVFESVGRPLALRDLPIPTPAAGQVGIRILACGVCRTDLHVVDGDLPDPKRPLILGHEIVGEVTAIGAGVDGFATGDRVGVPWLGHTCGHCRFCSTARENLCEAPGFTGYTIDGGYAEHTVADARFVFRLPEDRAPTELAPLLCAGLIGYRSYRMAGDARRIGFYGFGAAAHLLCQLAVHDGREVHAFTRPGDRRGQDFARGLGAVWAGGSDEQPPEPLDAAILFAPVGALVPAALRAVDRGGVVVAAGIHMSDIPGFPYAALWHERVIRSVANLTRRDGEEYFARITEVPVKAQVETFALHAANEALDALREGRFDGAAVLEP